MSSVIRNVMIALGTLLFVAAFSIMLYPGLSLNIPLQTALVTVLGILVFGQGLWMARTRWRGALTQVTLPSVEGPQANARPGSDIDSMLRELTRSGRGAIEYREQIRERLSEAAIAVIRQREDCTREVAIEKLENGTWTDDEFAASYFSGQAPPTAGSLLNQLSNLTGSNLQYEQWIDHTVNAIAKQAGMEPSSQTVERDTESTLRTLSVSLANRLGLGGGGRSTSSLGDDYSGWIEEDNIAPEPHDASDETFDGGVVAETVVRDIGRLRGVSMFGLIIGGVGIFTTQPALLVASVVGLGYAAFAHLSNDPSHDGLEIDRSVSEGSPSPNEEITVTVEVRNEGDRPLWDLRVVDRVPDAFRVVSGSPRHGTSLRSGERTTFQYTAIVERGKYSWPTLAISRDLTSTTERESVVQVESPITAVPKLDALTGMPVRAQTSVFAGSVATQTGGEGIEFFAVRDYRPGDPMNRIDWKRQAQTGELATLEFRVEQAASVVLLFDARESAYLSPSPDVKHSLNRSVDAGSQIFSSLFDAGNPVGIAAFDTVPCWLAPGATKKHREQARLILGYHPAIAPIPPSQKPDEGKYVDPMTHIRRQLSSHTQVVLFSPLCNDYAAEVASRLDTAGHLVTIVSPDPTVDGTTGQRLATVERETRMHGLRERGIRVLDWAPDEDFGLVLEQTIQQRW